MTGRDFFGAMGRGLMGVARWRGRDDRAAFWAYFALCFGAIFCVPSYPALDLYRELSSADRAAFLARIATSDDAHIMLNFHEMLAMFGAMRLLLMLALCAAMVRRLHDTGRPGTHAFLSLAGAALLMAGHGFATADLGQSIETMTWAQAKLSLPSLLWAGHFFYLVTLLMMPSDPNFNRWGIEPTSKRLEQAAALRAIPASPPPAAAPPRSSPVDDTRAAAFRPRSFGKRQGP